MHHTGWDVRQPESQVILFGRARINPEAPSRLRPAANCLCGQSKSRSLDSSITCSGDRTSVISTAWGAVRNLTCGSTEVQFGERHKTWDIANGVPLTGAADCSHIGRAFRLPSRRRRRHLGRASAEAALWAYVPSRSPPRSADLRDLWQLVRTALDLDPLHLIAIIDSTEARRSDQPGHRWKLQLL